MNEWYRQRSSAVIECVRRRILVPLNALLRQGIAPDRLALCVAVGIVVGNIPVLGVSTILCALIALLFRLNLPAIQLAQAAMAPTQLLLIIPFLRLGEWITRAPAQPLTVQAARALLGGSVRHAVAILWDSILRAGLAWSLIAPVAIFAVYRALIPLFTRAAAQLNRRRSNRLA